MAKAAANKRQRMRKKTRNKRAKCIKSVYWIVSLTWCKCVCPKPIDESNKQRPIVTAFVELAHNWYEFRVKHFQSTPASLRFQYSNRFSHCQRTLRKRQESQHFKQLICLNAWGRQAHTNFQPLRLTSACSSQDPHIFAFMLTALTYRFI